MNKQHVLLKKDPSGHHLSSMVTCPGPRNGLENMQKSAIPCDPLPQCKYKWVGPPEGRSL